MFYFSFSYFWILIPPMILAIYAQSKVNSTYNKYSRIRNMKGYTGADAAAALLRYSGITDVSIERVSGRLTDHYDPRTKVLRLSDAVYGSTSIAAIGVAAHETGHAVQHATGYTFLKLRSALVPISNIGSNLAMPLIIIGFILGGSGKLITIGIILFAIAVLFTIVTLPVEFNASSRAIQMLESNGILNYDEINPAKKVLSAAALTYVAAAASAVASLLRIVLMARNRD